MIIYFDLQFLERFVTRRSSAKYRLEVIMDKQMYRSNSVIEYTACP